MSDQTRLQAAIAGLAESFAGMSSVASAQTQAQLLATRNYLRMRVADSTYSSAGYCKIFTVPAGRTQQIISAVFWAEAAVTGADKGSATLSLTSDISGSGSAVICSATTATTSNTSYANPTGSLTANVNVLFAVPTVTTSNSAALLAPGTSLFLQVAKNTDSSLSTTNILPWIGVDVVCQDV